MSNSHSRALTRPGRHLFRSLPFNIAITVFWESVWDSPSGIGKVAGSDLSIELLSKEIFPPFSSQSCWIHIINTFVQSEGSLSQGQSVPKQLLLFYYFLFLLHLSGFGKMSMNQQLYESLFSSPKLYFPSPNLQHFYECY